MKFEKVTLEGNNVRLEPLGLHHKEGLITAFSDGELWNIMYTFVPRVEDVDYFILEAERQWEKGSALAYAIVDKATGNVAGTSRFKNTCWANRRVEVGYTFLGQSYQRTAINTETRLLMFSHAFESLEFIRVGFFIDYLNHNSRSAMLRLGAKEEGILRNHMIMPDGRTRDSVVFSIIQNEWQGVKQNLNYKLAQHRNSAQVIDLMEHTATT